MNISIVMTVMAEDKPGLVDAIASLVAEHAGNWLESRMSHLGGRFAGILRVEIPQEKHQAFLKATQQLQSKGWTIVAHSDHPSPVSSDSKEMVLEIVGQDRPGIVREISHALGHHKVNIEDLHTETSSAPMTGDTLFHARASVRVPPTCSTRQLRETLEKIAADLMVDLSFRETEAVVK